MSLGWPEPPWCAVVRRRAVDLAAAITEHVGAHRVSAVVVIPLDPLVVTARCAADRPACAHAISVAAGVLLWSERLLDGSVSLRVHVEGLTVDVDGAWLTGRRWDRESWRAAAALTLERR